MGGIRSRENSILSTKDSKRCLGTANNRTEWKSKWSVRDMSSCFVISWNCSADFFSLLVFSNGLKSRLFLIKSPNGKYWRKLFNFKKRFYGQISPSHDWEKSVESLNLNPTLFAHELRARWQAARQARMQVSNSQRSPTILNLYFWLP